MNKVKVIGTGHYVPSNVVSNNDLSSIVDTNDEWITTRTGIRERRISEGEDTSDMAAKAAIKALKASCVSAEDIDLIILGTATPDNFIPSTACMVQDKIGAVNATCFDISAACSGFVYGMQIAIQFLRTGSSKKALVIGAETLSKVVDWEDRNTCVLFADGASAAVLSISEQEGILSEYSGSDGSKGKFLTCDAVPVRNVWLNQANEEKIKNIIKMDGREIFKFGVKIIVKGVEELLSKTEYSLDDIKYIIPHQANYRIIELAAKKLNVGKDKFYLNLDRYGNTSAASVGIALDELVEKGMVKKGDKLILIGFGGGLTYGGLVIEL